MSTINSKNVQVGTSGTANQNFTLYQPASPDGTVRLGVGNSGATTGDVVTVSSSGVTVTGTIASSGVTTVPAGSASAPSISPSGDTNTGMFFPAADTIAFSEGGTEVARFDSSGNMGIGTTSPSQRLTVSGGLLVTDEIKGNNNLNLQKATLNNIYYTDAVAFTMSGTGERARIDSSGNLCLGRTSVGVGDRFVVQTISSGTIMLGYNSSASNTFQILENGNVRNTNNSYGAISDAKLKENVVDATPKLEKLNQVRIVNFNLIGDEQKQIGVIAQELEQIFPGMVEESPDRDEEGNDLGTTTKSVKYSVFVPMLIKAIQEQQALIQSLTQRIAALEGAQA